MTEQGLRQIAKRVAHWTIPPGFQSLGRRAVARRKGLGIPPALRAEFARNARFRDIHKGQRCFILATGPSISKQNLKPLKNEICFAVSMFFLHKDYREIDPLYHVFAPNHPPFGEDVPRRYLGGVNEVCSEKTTLFLGHRPYEHSYWSFLEKNPGFRREGTHYLNYAKTAQINEDNYDNPEIWDLGKALFGIRSVTYAAIQIAAYMGFGRIYLLGVDHDYLSHFPFECSAHFYEEERGIDDSVLHTSTEKQFLAYYRLWRDYRLMGKYLTGRGCSVYNATAGGYLDVYSRVALQEAIDGEHEE